MGDQAYHCRILTEGIAFVHSRVCLWYVHLHDRSSLQSMGHVMKGCRVSAGCDEMQAEHFLANVDESCLCAKVVNYPLCHPLIKISYEEGVCR